MLRPRVPRAVRPGERLGGPAGVGVPLGDGAKVRRADDRLGGKAV